MLRNTTTLAVVDIAVSVIGGHRSFGNCGSDTVNAVTAEEGRCRFLQYVTSAGYDRMRRVGYRYIASSTWMTASAKLCSLQFFWKLLSLTIVPNMQPRWASCAFLIRFSNGYT